MEQTNERNRVMRARKRDQRQNGGDAPGTRRKPVFVGFLSCFILLLVIRINRFLCSPVVLDRVLHLYFLLGLGWPCLASLRAGLA